jgi:hypothetical protein
MEAGGSQYKATLGKKLKTLFENKLKQKKPGAWLMW